MEFPFIQDIEFSQVAYHGCCVLQNPVASAGQKEQNRSMYPIVVERVSKFAAISNQEPMILADLL